MTNNFVSVYAVYVPPKDDLVCGLMPHNDRYPCFSRDWIDIDCNAIRCVYNKCNKCTVPSLAKINDEGKCQGFKNEHT